MENKKIKVGIVGGAGFTAGELIRILIHHPLVKISSIVSTSNAGNLVSKVHEDLLGDTDLIFNEKLNGEEEVIFLCLGHGNSRKFLEQNQLKANVKVIDLSNDLRLKKQSTFLTRDFIYGLIELNKDSIKASNNIANPGCFATSIQLALLPLAKNNLLKEAIHISAITGSTGAGRELVNTTGFNYRNNNISSYKEFTHQHLDEIKES
ncbi:MAG: N-acetyl-gamma-glutamyl-phosphate reductase, partial [Solirubrobacteraceae bacterium]